MPTHFSQYYICLLILTLFLTSCHSNQLLIPDIIDVKKHFHAVGDGIQDDTDAIQKALNMGIGRTIYIPSGTYMINALKSLNVRNNSKIVLDSNAILKAIPNASTGYAIIKLKNTSNVYITGKGKIIGERYEHLDDKGEWGMGIRIEGSNNFIIENIKVSNCWGDGLYICGNQINNQSSNGEIINVISLNNRRQGLSIVAGKDIKIIGGEYAYTNGIAPEGGIDLEPNTADGYSNEGITIDGVSSHHNKGDGIIISGSLNSNILINNIKSYSNNRGITFATVGQGITISNSKSYKNAKEGIKASSLGDHIITNLTILGNETYENGFEGITLWNNVENSIVSKNHSYNNGYHGIHLRPTKLGVIRYNKINKNICTGNGTSKNKAFNNIHIGENSTENSIEENIVKLGDNKNKPAYGLFIFYGAKNNTLIKNKTLKGGATSGFRDSSTKKRN